MTQELPTNRRTATERKQELVEAGWQEDDGKWIKGDESADSLRAAWNRHLIQTEDI